MEIQLQDLIDQIKKDGVASAEAEAESMLPAQLGLSILPGMAKTSRPCSSASSAVMRAPLF